MNDNIQLYYFRGRGRAETIRILLNYLELSYEDVFIDTHEAMETLQVQQLSPFKQIPILHIDNHYLVQTPAIFRYLARKYNLYGNNDFEKYRCDMLIAAALDWQAKGLSINKVYNCKFSDTLKIWHDQLKILLKHISQNIMLSKVV